MKLHAKVAMTVALVVAGATACGVAAEEPTETNEPTETSEQAFGGRPVRVPPLNEELSVDEQAGEAEAFEGLARDITEIQRLRAAGNGGVARGFHTKPHACVLGELRVLSDRPAETKFGVFAEDKTYRAWIRLSNAQSARNADKTADARGLAVKLLDVPGAKILPGQESATTQDFLSVTSNTLLAKDAQTFMAMSKALNEGGLTAAAFLASHPKLALALARSVHPVASMFTERYWSGVPFKLGPRAIKFSFTPCTRLDRPNAATFQSSSYLREDAVRTLESEGACFDLSVQFQRDPVKQPVEDSSVPWKENEAPFVRVAQLILPKQDMHSAEAKRKEAFCEALVWNPWHSLPEHRPLGNANRARKVVMLSAQKYRGAPEPPAEPTGTETFDTAP